MNRKIIDLMTQRTAQLDAAQSALDAGNKEAYAAAMERVTNMNGEIQNLQNLESEQARVFSPAPSAAELRDMAEDRGAELMSGHVVNFTASEIRAAIRTLTPVENSTTLATGTLLLPSGAGSNVRDPIGNVVSSIVDQVSVIDLTGMGDYREPYLITESDAKGGKVTTNAGNARTASADPTFGVAKISPYELNVTQFVDRNISRLTPANYYDKIFGMAMRALRRKTAEMIANGDSQATPDFFGIKTAKNVVGAAIYATQNISAITESTLDDLFFAYGDDSMVGSGARLYLTKQDLKAFGNLRNSDKERVFKIHPDAGNPNSGTIEDGGNFIPYTILRDLTSLSTATAGASPIQTMFFGDPMNFELGLFGDYSIRVDDSIKGVERMTTILGDAMVGGNLIVDKGFVVATLPTA